MAPAVPISTGTGTIRKAKSLVVNGMVARIELRRET
jgi:hypothetical protein